MRHGDRVWREVVLNTLAVRVLAYRYGVNDVPFGDDARARPGSRRLYDRRAHVSPGHPPSRVPELVIERDVEDICAHNFAYLHVSPFLGFALCRGWRWSAQPVPPRQGPPASSGQDDAVEQVIGGEHQSLGQPDPPGLLKPEDGSDA